MRSGVRLVPVTYAGPRTEVPVSEGERCPDFIYANHGDWDYARVDFDDAAFATLRDHLNDFDDPLVRSMLWQGVFEMILYQQMTPAEYIDFALANVGAESDDEVIRQVLDALQAAWSYQRRLADDGSLVEIGARIEDYLWRAFLDSESGSDRQLLLFDNYQQALASAEGLDRLEGFLAGDELPEEFDFDQDHRWTVLEQLSGVGHPRTEALLAVERGSGSVRPGQATCVVGGRRAPGHRTPKAPHGHAARSRRELERCRCPRLRGWTVSGASTGSATGDRRRSVR